MIFMRFKKWVIFIKELRDWYINKWYSKDNYLIENHDIDNDSMKFYIERNERYCIIIWLNIFLKMYNLINSNDLFIDIDMNIVEKYLNWFRNIVFNRQDDSALWTTHWKYRINSSKWLNILLFSMKSITIIIVKYEKL